MSRVRVTQERSPYGSDWTTHCEEHRMYAVCFSWENAMETAYGHLAMHHPDPYRVTLRVPPAFKRRLRQVTSNPAYYPVAVKYMTAWGAVTHIPVSSR